MCYLNVNLFFKIIKFKIINCSGVFAFERFIYTLEQRFSKASVQQRHQSLKDHA